MLYLTRKATGTEYMVCKRKKPGNTVLKIPLPWPWGWRAWTRHGADDVEYYLSLITHHYPVPHLPTTVLVNRNEHGQRQKIEYKLDGKFGSCYYMLEQPDLTTVQPVLERDLDDPDIRRQVLNMLATSITMLRSERIAIDLSGADGKDAFVRGWLHGEQFSLALHNLDLKTGAPGDPAKVTLTDIGLLDFRGSGPISWICWIMTYLQHHVLWQVLLARLSSDDKQTSAYRTVSSELNLPKRWFHKPTRQLVRWWANWMYRVSRRCFPSQPAAETCNVLCKK